MDKLTILAEIAITDEGTQEELWEYVSATVGHAFASLSLKIQDFLKDKSSIVDNNFKRKEDIEIHEKHIFEVGIVSAHFMPVYWSLDLINKANDDDKLFNMRHLTFGVILIEVTLILLHSFFAIAGARNFSTLDFNTHSWWIIAFIIMLNFLFFVFFLLSWIFARQIIKPFIKEHDVFELKRIFEERTMVNKLVFGKFIERVPRVEE